MIIVRSPLRITLGGGGTDIASYYEHYGGFTIAAAINRYVYLTIHETFIDDLIIKYSQLERIQSAVEIQHPIFREAMILTKIDGKSLELSSLADIPAGTGLGSSSSFTTALLQALHTYKKELISAHDLAEEACAIEIDKLGAKIGKQDQYIAAYGGVRSMHFQRDGRVDINSMNIAPETLYNLEDNLVLFFTGYSRSATEILKSQSETRETEFNLHELLDIAHQTDVALQHDDMYVFAKLLSQQWELKRQRYPSASTRLIDTWYALGMHNGALGGKLVGAGGGGFLLFYAEDKTNLRRTMNMAGLREVRFRFDFDGTRVVV